MKHYRIQFFVLENENWKLIEDALFPARNHSRAVEAGKKSEWARKLVVAHPEKKHYIGWQGED